MFQKKLEVSAAYAQRFYMRKLWGPHFSVHVCILEQLKSPSGLQGQPHVRCIAIIQMGGDQGKSDYEQLSELYCIIEWYTTPVNNIIKENNAFKFSVLEKNVKVFNASYFIFWIVKSY